MTVEVNLLEQISSQLSALSSSSGPSSAEQLTAALLFSNILTNPQNDPALALTASHSNTTQASPQTIYGPTPIGGQYGALLASVSISVDAIFQTNYKWQLLITGVTSPNPPFQDFDPTVNTFDDVPTAKFYFVKPGANIQINVYNSVSGNTSDGIMSVFPVWNQLTSSQYAVIRKYMGSIEQF